MSYHRLRPAQGGGADFAILFDAVGRGTQWLSRRRPGDRIFVYGPLGRGYAVRRDAGNLLLVAGGIGVAPLVWLADEQVARGRHVTLIQGARSADGLFPAHLLPPEVEVVAVTEDGSLGQRGLVTDLVPEYLSWADQVFACGPNAMFRALAEVVRRVEGEGARRRRKSVQVLLEEVMPCGTGICYGCAVETRRGRAPRVQRRPALRAAGRVLVEEVACLAAVERDMRDGMREKNRVVTAGSAAGITQVVPRLESLSATELASYRQHNGRS